MYKTTTPACPGFSRSVSFLFGTLLTAVLMLSLPARAEDVDDQYVHVLTTMQQGALMKTAGNNDVALPKSREAQTALQVFRKAHPEWNPKVAAFRANVIVEKIAALTGETPG